MSKAAAEKTAPKEQKNVTGPKPAAVVVSKPKEGDTDYYTSAHGSGRRYYILPLKFLSFFFFRRRISEMALPTGNLSSSDGRI